MPPLPEQQKRPDTKVAMRQFHYGPPKNRSLLSQRLEFWWYVVMPVFVIAAISACGLWAGLHYYKSADKNTTVQRSLENNRLELDTINSRSEFLDRYAAAKGSAALQSSIKMKVSGTYSDKNGVQVFSGSFDFQGNGIFRLEFTESVELQYAEGRLVSIISPLFEAEAALIAAFIESMQDPLLALTDPAHAGVLKLEPTDFMGIEAIEAHIESTEADFQTSLTISASSLTILECTTTSGDSPAARYRYSDYNMVAGVRMPHTISIKDPLGELHRIQITRLASANADEPSYATR